MAFYPYLVLTNRCREAFARYQEIFGGELVLLPMSEMPADQPVPDDQRDLIMHAALTIEGGGLLMGSDDPTGDGGPMRGMAVNYTVSDVDEAKRVFAELADGGETTMPISPTFWSPMFGMCVDRFGTSWMVNAEQPTES